MKGLLGFILVMSVAWTGVSPAGSRAEDLVRIDLSERWFRRDWDNCKDPTEMREQNGVLTISSEVSAALFWQVPTRSGKPLDVDLDQEWVQECDRPPADFGKRVLREDRDGRKLLDISEYRTVSWRWRVNGTIDDTDLADSGGKIRKRNDDFAAKIGISILSKEEGKLREIAYIWTRTLPEESVLTHVTTVIPGIWKYKWYRIVAESGEANVNRWVTVTRDLYSDYKRLYPKEEPGRIARVYLMADSDNTESQVTTSFADLIFYRHNPDVSDSKGRPPVPGHPVSTGVRTP